MINYFKELFLIEMSIICLSAISPCDDNFSIDSYAITVFKDNNTTKGIDFISHSNYYWIQSFPEKRIPKPLPEGVTRVDGAFFLDTTNCSKKDNQLIAIVGNTFSTFSLVTNQWKTNQSLKNSPFLSRILDPISNDMKIEAITDWRPNRIIVFRNKTYTVIEWVNICEAIDGKGLTLYPTFTTDKWFDNSSVDSTQLLSENRDQNQTLLLFSESLSRKMIVNGLSNDNQSIGQMIGRFQSIKPLKDWFICFDDIEYIPMEDLPIAEPAMEESQSLDNSPKVAEKDSSNPLPAIICAIILLSIVFMAFVIILPKDKYIIREDN